MAAFGCSPRRIIKGIAHFNFVRDANAATGTNPDAYIPISPAVEDQRHNDVARKAITTKFDSYSLFIYSDAHLWAISQNLFSTTKRLEIKGQIAISPLETYWFLRLPK